MFAAQGAGPDDSLTPPIVEAAEPPSEDLNVWLLPNTEIQVRNRETSEPAVEIVRKSSLFRLRFVPIIIWS